MFLIFYFTIFLVIKMNSTLYGGWRHLYFLYGVDTILSNLRPICAGCNLDMNTQNWNDYDNI